ncbi:MAG TPA: lipid II flippase MurJ, partial [Aggregatilineaceae bacterium]|nr:lipid II flippase MurJ [Aggregatilineaceae bacterium]
AEDSALVYGALQFFAFGLIFQSIHEIIARSFYADKDTLTPLWVSIIAAIANVVIVGTLYLIYVNQLDDPLRTVFNDWGTRFADGQYPAALTEINHGAALINDRLAGPTGVGALAIGYSSIFLIELALLLVILHRRWGSIEGRALTFTTLRTGAAALVMGIAVLVVDGLFGVIGWHDAGVIITALRVLVLAGVGTVTFVVAAILLGVQEIRSLPQLVRRRSGPVLAPEA